MTSKDLQKIKSGRLSEPEKVIFESFKGLQEYTYNNNTEWVYYKSNNGCFYCYHVKNNWLRYDYDLIYLKIQFYFEYNVHKVNDFVRMMVEKQLKLKVDTSHPINQSVDFGWKTISMIKI